MKTKQPEIAKVLIESLNREVKDIYVTGFSEIMENYNLFTPLLWWYYIEFENYFLCIESDELTLGGLEFQIHQQIQRNFKIEDEEIFTITSINDETYTKIISYDLFYGNHDSQLYGLGINFENNKYIFFDSISIDGIEVGSKTARKNLMEDKRLFYTRFPE